MNVKVVSMKEVQIFESIESLLSAAPKLGLTHTGFEGARHLSKFLIGLPKFKELAGPMGDGKTENGQQKVRYETLEANEFYSS